MRIQVVCPMMNQTDFSNVLQMNLQTDAVIANQADTNFQTELIENGHRFLMITTDTRGASVNRNISIANATSDIVLFSDDDQTFVDGYEKMVIDAFKKYPDAHGVKFYCQSTTPTRPLSYKRPADWKKAGRLDLTSAGVHGFALKRDFLEKNNIRFNEEIGPGKEIYCGEDTEFIVDLFKNKANIYLSPDLISYVDQSDSSWFKGFDDEWYFISVGYVYATIYGRLARLAALRRCIVMKKKTKKFSSIQMYRMILEGIRKQKNSKKS